MAQQQAIRDYLKSRGLKDEEIGYDNGTVLAKGKRFMDATPNADGRTYADTQTLDNAYNHYDTINQIADLRTRAQTPNAELTGMQQAIKERINKPVQQFNYDQNTDPQYQNAIAQAKQNAQTAGNNAMVALGSRGIGNSSITGDRVAQIQQKELGNVTANVLPQLISQAYQRYIGQANLEQQQTGNMLQYTDYLDRSGQQQFRNSYDLLNQQSQMNQNDIQNQHFDSTMADKQKQDRIALANYLTTTYGKQVDPKMDSQLAYDQVKGLDPLALREFMQRQQAQDAGLTGYINGQPTMSREQMQYNNGLQDKKYTLDERQTNANINNMNNDNTLNKDRFSWEKDPTNPDNMEKLARINELTTKGDKKLQDESKGLVEALRGAKMTPGQAIQQIDEDVQLGFYSADEAVHLKSIITTLSPNLPVSDKQKQLTPEQQAAIPSNAELDKLYKEQGNGAPLLDWKSWYKDPQGKSAGVTFDTWKQLYGPKMGK